MEPDREAVPHTGAMSADQLTQALLTSLSSDNSSSMQLESSSRASTGSGATIVSTTGMSIAVPFSSHDSTLDIPRDPLQPANYDSFGALLQEETPGLFSAKPLAVKPVYRKRPIPIPARSDGLIRRTGTVAAIEKDLSVGGARVARAKKGKNIYDETEINTQTPPEPPVQNTIAAPQSVVPPKPKRTPRPRTKRKRAAAPLEQPEELEPARRRKRIRYKRQIVWRPKTPLTPGMMGEGINRPSGLKRPTRRDHAIELLISKQEQNREKMINMTQKPLILQELQALMDARIAAEDRALTELGVMLHKELLKLQLEEGALLQMMAAVQEGRLDPSDLRRVGPGKERYGLTAVMRKPKKSKKSALPMQDGPVDEETASINIDGESLRGQSNELGISDTEGDENDREDNEDNGEGDDDDEQDGEDEEGDEDEDEDSDEDDEEEEDEDDDVDQEDADRKSKMLRTLPESFYPRLSESYASRPIVSDNIGKETVKGRPANTSSKDDIKLVIDRARKRTQLEGDQKDWEHQGSDIEDENVENVEDEGEEEAQNEDFDEPISDEEDDDSEEEEEDEEEEGDDDGKDYDDDDEARDALQRMLKEYGAPV